MKPILPSINDINFRQLNTNDMPGPELMEDFMKHCYDKLRNFAKVQWYEQNSIRFSSPEESHQYMVWGLILNGAKAEDEYVVGCLNHLGYPGDYLYRCMQNDMGLMIVESR